MDDQDWTNLQQLVGRGPQPWPLPSPTPDHILMANLLAAQGGGQLQPLQPTPDQLAMAQAIRNYGGPGGTNPGGSAPAPTALQTYSARIPGGSTASDGASLVDASQSTDPATAPDAPTQYAMASPANVDLPWQQMADQDTAPAPKPAPTPQPPPAAPSSVQTTIDPIPGYDETGDYAWRKANDQTFLDAVNRYNAANGYRPGDPGYWTADLLKAQAMRESGNNKHVFLTDPLQVNNPGDWDSVNKPKIGLSYRQAMTPKTSADAALKWLQFKGWDRSNGQRNYLGDVTALQRYNGRTDSVAGLPNVTFSELYAGMIMQLASEAAQTPRNRAVRN